MPIVFALLLLLSGGSWASGISEQSSMDGPWVEVGNTRYEVELALDHHSQMRGLMFRESLPERGGMLFVFGVERPQSFWMKNTLIPLDMIFADDRGVVQRVHSNAVPGDLTAIPGGPNIQYVLEINGGLAQSLGIAPGAEMQHPAIDQEKSTWPCPGG
jgi:hypothetical protein